MLGLAAGSGSAGSPSPLGSLFTLQGKRLWLVANSDFKVDSRSGTSEGTKFSKWLPPHPPQVRESGPVERAEGNSCGGAAKHTGANGLGRGKRRWEEVAGPAVGLVQVRINGFVTLEVSLPRRAAPKAEGTPPHEGSSDGLNSVAWSRPADVSSRPITSPSIST